MSLQELNKRALVSSQGNAPNQDPSIQHRFQSNLELNKIQNRDQLQKVSASVQDLSKGKNPQAQNPPWNRFITPRSSPGIKSPKFFQKTSSNADLMANILDVRRGLRPVARGDKGQGDPVKEEIPKPLPPKVMPKPTVKRKPSDHHVDQNNLVKSSQFIEAQKNPSVVTRKDTVARQSSAVAKKPVGKGDSCGAEKSLPITERSEAVEKPQKDPKKKDETKAQKNLLPNKTSHPQNLSTGEKSCKNPDTLTTGPHQKTSLSQTGNPHNLPESSIEKPQMRPLSFRNNLPRNLPPKSPSQFFPQKTPPNVFPRSLNSFRRKLTPERATPVTLELAKETPKLENSPKIRPMSRTNSGVNFATPTPFKKPLSSPIKVPESPVWKVRNPANDEKLSSSFEGKNSGKAPEYKNASDKNNKEVLNETQKTPSLPAKAEKNFPAKLDGQVVRKDVFPAKTVRNPTYALPMKATPQPTWKVPAKNLANEIIGEKNLDAKTYPEYSCSRMFMNGAEL